MGIEIERKFLVQVEKLPDLTQLARTTIVQGYLPSQLRIRIEDYRLYPTTSSCKSATLTLKGPGDVSRTEYNWPIPLKDAAELLSTCKAIRKIRYQAAGSDGHLWEIDHFLEPMWVPDGDPKEPGVLYQERGELFPLRQYDLWLAEIELTQEDEVFASPSWLGEEVTHDARFKNVNLAAYQAEGRELQRADLYECEECSRKSGSPRLCSRCLEARDKAGNAWRGARVYT